MAQSEDTQVRVIPRRPGQKTPGVRKRRRLAFTFTDVAPGEAESGRAGAAEPAPRGCGVGEP